MVSLGVSLDLSRVWEGQILVSNKPGRLAKIAELLKPIAAGSEVTRSQLASLHGLINFAGGYVMGFELKPTARMLSRALTGPFQGNNAALRSACALALDVIALCKPRVCLASVRQPIVLYTDGAFEGDAGTWGSLLVDPETGARWLFGGQVPQVLIARWREMAGLQVICEIEAYALAISLFGLRGFLGNRSIVAFVDNEPCRMGLIKRYSPSAAMMGLISLVSLLEGSLCTTLWYERVPSKSNPADLPSRGLFPEAASRFGAEIKGDIACTQEMNDFLVSDQYSSRLAQAIAEAVRFEASMLAP